MKFHALLTTLLGATLTSAIPAPQEPDYTPAIPTHTASGTGGYRPTGTGGYYPTGTGGYYPTGTSGCYPTATGGPYPTGAYGHVRGQYKTRRVFAHPVQDDATQSRKVWPFRLLGQ